MTFKCKCGFEFDFQYQLIMHQYSHAPVHDENESTWRCDLCDLFFINQDHLVNHNAQHVKEQKFVCGQCNKSFKTENRYIHHIADPTVHFNGYKCSLCSKTLSNKKYLQNHLRLHTRETNFACETCQKQFITKNKLDVHKKHHSPDFRCSICSETFKSKLILIGHHRSKHNGSEVFQCSQCPKKYLKQGHLKTHLRTHEANSFQAENNKFRCNECGKSFQTNGNLTFHQRSHKKLF